MEIRPPPSHKHQLGAVEPTRSRKRPGKEPERQEVSDGAPLRPRARPERTARPSPRSGAERGAGPSSPPARGWQRPPAAARVPRSTDRLPDAAPRTPQALPAAASSRAPAPAPAGLSTARAKARGHTPPDDVTTPPAARAARKSAGPAPDSVGEPRGLLGLHGSRSRAV